MIEKISLDTGHIVLIVCTLLSIGWGFYQLREKRKHEKQDRFLQNKNDIYHSYLKKADELNNKLRQGANEIFSLFGKLISAEV